MLSHQFKDIGRNLQCLFYVFTIHHLYYYSITCNEQNLLSSSSTFAVLAHIAGHWTFQICNFPSIVCSTASESRVSKREAHHIVLHPHDELWRLIFNLERMFQQFPATLNNGDYGMMLIIHPQTNTHTRVLFNRIATPPLSMTTYFLAIFIGFLYPTASHKTNGW